jgi:hypothetical protein
MTYRSQTQEQRPVPETDTTGLGDQPGPRRCTRKTGIYRTIKSARQGYKTKERQKGEREKEGKRWPDTAGKRREKSKGQRARDSVQERAKDREQEIEKEREDDDENILQRMRERERERGK